MNAPYWIIGVIAVVLIGGGIYLTTAPTTTSEEAMEKEQDVMMENTSAGEEEMMEKDGAMMKDEGAMMEKGSYEAYAPEKLSKADQGDVVLFFRASWCPTCRALDADLRANADLIPKGLVILDVNYDTETALKQKYGVTYQHTFVQVSSDGALIRKWNGSSTLSALVAEVE